VLRAEQRVAGPPARGRVITLPVRRVAQALPARPAPARLAPLALSILLHGLVLLACAWRLVVTPVEPPPITVTLLGTAPDAGGSGAPQAPAAVAPAPPPVAPPPVQARPVPVLAPPPKPKRAAVRRAAPKATASDIASATAAFAPAPAAAGGLGTAGGGNDGGGGPGSGVGRGRGPGVQGDPSGSAVASYLERLRLRLESVKRYPPLARRRGAVGTATIHIVIGRDGRPTAVRLEHSSGSELLDDEAEEMVSRAAPFEPLPAEVAADLLQVTVPVRFDVNS